MKTTHTYYLMFLDQESGHSSLGSLLRISPGFKGVSQAAFSPRRSAWERLSSKISAVARKNSASFHCEADVKIFFLAVASLPRSLSVPCSTALSVAFLQYDSSHFQNQRRRDSSSHWGWPHSSMCFQLIKSGPPRMTYF